MKIDDLDGILSDHELVAALNAAAVRRIARLGRKRVANLE